MVNLGSWRHRRYGRIHRFNWRISAGFRNPVRIVRRSFSVGYVCKATQSNVKRGANCNEDSLRCSSFSFAYSDMAYFDIRRSGCTLDISLLFDRSRVASMVHRCGGGHHVHSLYRFSVAKKQKAVIAIAKAPVTLGCGWASASVVVLGFLAFVFGLFLFHSGFSIGILVSLIGASTVITFSVYGVRAYRKYE